MKRTIKYLWLIAVLLSMPFSCRHTRQLSKSTLATNKDSATVKKDTYRSNVLDSIVNSFKLSSLSVNNKTKLTIERYGVEEDADDATEPIVLRGKFELSDSIKDGGLQFVNKNNGTSLTITDKGVTINDPGKKKKKTIPYEKMEFESDTNIQHADSSGTLAAKHAAVIDTSKHDSTHVKADKKKEGKQ